MTILNYITDFVFADECDKERQELCNTILEQKPEHVFLNIAWEAYTFSSNMLLVDEFLFDHGIPATWVIHNWSENTTQWEPLKCSTVFIDLMMWRVYNEIIVKKTNGTNPAWNPDADRYLFLTGKPDKPQRIGLLYQLYAHNLMNKCDHSLFMSAGMYV